MPENKHTSRISTRVSYSFTCSRANMLMLYIDTALADRTAQLLRQPPPASTAVHPDAQSQALPSHERTSTPTKGKEHETNPSELLATLRADLATTQKARSTLQAQLADLTAQLSVVSIQQRASQSQVTTLTKQVFEAERKLQDRDEELRGKSKLVEQAQDEMVALELQFNLAEQRSEKLEKENKELVERWMKRMGEEAERVNRDSRWS
jgi:chromosome segregation ATPase